MVTRIQMGVLSLGVLVACNVELDGAVVQGNRRRRIGDSNPLPRGTSCDRQ